MSNTGIRDSGETPQPPDQRKDRIAFREVFLLHAPPAGAATLRRFGAYMYETLVEAPLQETPTPSISARLRAVAEDLRFSAQVLAALGQAREAGGLAPEELALSMKAESWAREVAELVRALEGAAAGSGGTE